MRGVCKRHGATTKKYSMEDAPRMLPTYMLTVEEFVGDTEQQKVKKYTLHESI